uniref:Secreted protein n=1 Tax=Heterorhabditis bacteriophora TaxID=37862 RepID=A0A1I7WD25_HETBA
MFLEDHLWLYLYFLIFEYNYYLKFKIFQLSRLSVESRTPGWQSAQDLRQTRINCSTINRTLMYKQESFISICFIRIYNFINDITNRFTIKISRQGTVSIFAKTRSTHLSAHIQCVSK